MERVFGVCDRGEQSRCECDTASHNSAVGRSSHIYARFARPPMWLFSGWRKPVEPTRDRPVRVTLFYSSFSRRARPALTAWVDLVDRSSEAHPEGGVVFSAINTADPYNGNADVDEGVTVKPTVVVSSPDGKRFVWGPDIDFEEVEDIILKMKNKPRKEKEPRVAE